MLNRLAHSVLWPGFAGTRALGWVLHSLEAGLGGVVYFAQDIDPRDLGQVNAFSASIHNANPDALIGVDEKAAS